MALKYTIKVMQESNNKTYNGKSDSVDEIIKVLNEINNTLIKGNKAVVTMTYAPISNEELDYERAKRKAIVKEEFDRVMNEVNENE